jgi:hypothetical protein
MALSLDRQAFLDILTEGKGNLGGVMLPPPEGVWGMPPEILHSLPGYGPDVAKNRAEAREIMQKLGYGPDKRLTVKVSTRDIPPFRGPAVLLLDQLKEIYIDAELEPIDTTQWFPRVNRKDLLVTLRLRQPAGAVQGRGPIQSPLDADRHLASARAPALPHLAEGCLDRARIASRIAEGVARNTRA